MPQREIDTKARGVHSHMRRLHSDPLLIRSQPLTFVRSEAAWTLPVCSSANLRLLGRAGGGKKPCAVGCRGGGALLMAVLKGVHAQVPPHLILPCFRKVIGMATVRCWCGRNDALQWLCRAMCASLGKMPTVKVVPPTQRNMPSQSLLV